MSEKTVTPGLSFAIGSSMYPTLLPGDELVVVKSYRLHIGDIIGYRLENRNMIHRIVKINHDMIYTKGDNNLIIDLHPITKKNIIGKLIKVRRRGKTITINNGFAGFLTGRKCQLTNKMNKLVLSTFIKSVTGFKPIVCLSNKIGQLFLNRHLTIIKQKNNRFNIYCGKTYCGYYDVNGEQIRFRNRFKLFFSEKQLQKKINDYH